MSRSRSLAVLGLTLFPLLVGCSKRVEPAPAASEPARASHVDRRDQYALVDALDDAQEASGGERARRYGEIKSSWQGRRFNWELRVVPALCSSPDSCFAVGFDYARTKKRIVQGWLPRLELDAAIHAKLVETCKPHAACVIDVEAKLTRLVASNDLPTSVTLGEVTIAGARAEKPSESWGRAPVEAALPKKTAPEAALALGKR